MPIGLRLKSYTWRSLFYSNGNGSRRFRNTIHYVEYKLSAHLTYFNTIARFFTANGKCKRT